MTPLERFGQWALLELRQDGGGDIDGGAGQDKMLELGLIGYVTVAEPCGENCRCAEYYDEFPAECLRATPLAKLEEKP